MLRCGCCVVHCSKALFGETSLGDEARAAILAPVAAPQVDGAGGETEGGEGDAGEPGGEAEGGEEAEDAGRGDGR